MTDAEFTTFFTRAADAGFRAFKIKVGHPDPAWDLHRLDLLKQTVGPDAGVMIDANEGWSAKEAATRLALFRHAGHDLIWVEDPIMRDDFDGLRALSAAHPWTQINSGEYLDVSGRARLLMARATDIINLHGRIPEVMRVGWLAHELGIPVAMGNTTLELGVHTGAALPNAAGSSIPSRITTTSSTRPSPSRMAWPMSPTVRALALRCPTPPAATGPNPNRWPDARPKPAPSAAFLPTRLSNCHPREETR